MRRKKLRTYQLRVGLQVDVTIHDHPLWRGLWAECARFGLPGFLVPFWVVLTVVLGPPVGVGLALPMMSAGMRGRLLCGGGEG
jgi:hypothetical protein